MNREINSKHYFVYLASNHGGLDIERHEIQLLMAQHNMVNVGLPCRDDASPYDWDLVRAQIERADLFILLLGDHYGSVLPTGISYLHREYVYARSLNKPILAFLKNCVSSIQQSEEQRKLAGFHHMVIQQSAYKLWHLRDELLSHVRAALSSSLLTIGHGWLPAQQVDAGAQAAVTENSKKQLTPRQRQALARQMLNLQVTAKVYQAGNLFMEDSYVPSRLDLLYQALFPLLQEMASEERLKKYIEDLVYEDVKRDLLQRHRQAHAVDDVRLNRSQFQKILESWRELDFVFSKQANNRTLWGAVSKEGTGA